MRLSGIDCYYIKLFVRREGVGWVTHVFWRADETALYKVAEVGGVALGQFGRGVAGDLEEDTHRGGNGVGGCTLGELYRGYTQ